jgi:hypothetical protein
MNPHLDSEFVDAIKTTELERQLARKLPESYRSFVLAHTVVPEPAGWGDGVDEVEVHALFGVDDLLGMTDGEDLDVDKLLIATCSGGNHFAVDLRSGEISFREHEHPVDDVRGRYRAVAPSFEAFLEAFHE